MGIDPTAFTSTKKEKHLMKSKVLVPGLNDISNEDYHADKTRLSSTNLKTLIKDPAKFYDEKILGNRVSVQKNAFDEGSLVHAMILEPEVIDSEFAFFDGWTKRGKDYTAFKEANPNKIWISMPQKKRCQDLTDAFLRKPAAVDLLKTGVAEQTLCGELNGVDIKVRFDWVDVERGFIMDVKTSAFPIDADSFKMTVEKWEYDLSAALYLRMAEQYFGKKLDFYFVALGKQDQDCEIYRLSEETRHLGDMKITKALNIFKQCKETGVWERPDQPEPVSEDDYEILEV